MPALLIFLFKVNIALVLFCLGYYLVLRHLTFYTLNRIYLVVAILFSTLYPKINLSDFAQQHELTRPVQTVILNWKAPAENFVKPLYQPDYWQWVELIFWTGAALFAIRLMMQIFSLYKLYRNSEPGQLHNYSVRLISADISPFSFWRSIYINPTSLSPSELKGILEHEQIHVNEWHTLDILLAELSTIFYWFNPGVWLMKKAVRENIEFITDRKILQKGIDSKEYQYSLVSVSLGTSPNAIVNHFNISTIKKRIIMMNTKRSSSFNLTRYLFLVPAVMTLLLVFSFSKAAISKSGLHSLKSIATVISNVKLINSANPYIVPVKQSVPRPPAKVNSHYTDVDTIYAGKAKSKKDGKNVDKSFTMISDQKADSINYVINGVKATKAELKALDPARIQSLEMLPADKAKEFAPALNNTHDVLFVTTDDSETGKKLKEKMDKAIGVGMLAGGKNISVASVSSSSNAAPVAVGSNNVYISTADGDSDAVVVTGSGSNNVSSSVRIVTDPKIVIDPKVVTKVATLSKNNVYVVASPSPVYHIKTIDAASPEYKVDVVKVKGVANVKPMVYKISNMGESSIDNLSEKLIVIDGKEASEKEMKNLKMADIKSLTEKTDIETKKKYGDKAKNGVLFITTKK